VQKHKDLITTRANLPGDHAFIMATWLRGAYFGNPWFNLIPMTIYMLSYHTFLENLLQLPGVVVKVACLREDPDVILGYSVSCGTRLHWVFVKSAWRKIGIGRSLLPEKLESVSHITEVGRSLLKKCPSVIFNPF
jgi:hypothetical protein